MLLRKLKKPRKRINVVAPPFKNIFELFKFSALTSILIQASVVHISNGHKMGHCLMIYCKSTVVPMQYLLKI